MKKIFFLTQIFCILFICFVSNSSRGDTCVDGFRVRLAPEPTGVFAKFKANIATRLKRKKPSDARVQSEKVDAFLAERWESARSKAKTPEDVQVVWEQELQQWGESLTERSWNNKIQPSIEEMLAYMAARSPTFYGGLTELFRNNSSFVYKTRWSVWGLVNSAGNLVAGLGNTAFMSVQAIRGMVTLFNKKIRVSVHGETIMGQIITAEEFAKFANGISELVIKANRPHGVAGLYKDAFLNVVYSPKEFKVWSTFSELLNKRREHFTSFLSQTSIDFAGDFSGKVDPHFSRVLDVLHQDGILPNDYVKPRDPVLAEMYRFGIVDTAIRRLTGALKKGKTAYNLEAEMLAGEFFFFIRPVLSPLLLFAGVNIAVDAANESNAQKENLGAAPQATTTENSIDGTKHNDIEALQGYEKSIMELTLKRFAFESQLQEKHSSSENVEIRRQLDEINAEIRSLQKKKLQIQGGSGIK